LSDTVSSLRCAGFTQLVQEHVWSGVKPLGISPQKIANETRCAQWARLVIQN